MTLQESVDELTKALRELGREIEKAAIADWRWLCRQARRPKPRPKWKTKPDDRMRDERRDLDGRTPCKAKCRKCAGANVAYRVVESSCGGYDDVQYRCGDCDHQWWVDGPDS